MVDASELSIFTSVLQGLRPIEVATREVSGDKYCTSSKVIPLIHCLILKVESLQLEDSLGKDLQSLVLKEIAKRMSVIQNVTTLAIATIVDPRFKKVHFMNPLACSSAVTKIKDLIKTTAQNEVESDSLDHSEKPEDNFSLWEDHQKLVRKNWKTSKTDGTISDELFIFT
ncbi:Zinc finger BED domain-containing protein 4 [Eumeta japonica]|uniref:Zinc finger BED domain-containing protein 4 n=1 Tax=Eumeta variegata TaxID=151549 RepID=A0A4C2A743_EUMVA|nr:Zinc finger BED domain-containing protein 4 [Eumeta japonica]